MNKLLNGLKIATKDLWGRKIEWAQGNKILEPSRCWAVLLRPGPRARVPRME